MELPADAIEEVLERWPVARLVTQGPRGGAPVPVVFARAEGLLWTPVDGKPKSGAELARVRHVRHDPRVTLLLDHYEADWRRLWWLRVEGAARVAGERDSRFGAASAALGAKYPQYAETPLFQGAPTLLCIAPGPLRSWCAGPEAAAATRPQEEKR